MRKRVLGWIILSLGTSVAVMAQPPGAPRGERPGPGGFGPGPGGRPPLPIVDAIDKDRDGILSKDEIEAATAALMTLDKNGDGKLTEEEFLPLRRGPGGPERGPGGPERGPGGRERGPGGPERGPAPSPERFVEHALEFDADGDGKLDRSELMKFAEQMPNHRPGGPGMGGPGRERPEMGPGRQRGPGDGPRREGDRPRREGGDRPAPPPRDAGVRPERE